MEDSKFKLSSSSHIHHPMAGLWGPQGTPFPSEVPLAVACFLPMSCVRVKMRSLKLLDPKVMESPWDCEAEAEQTVSSLCKTTLNNGFYLPESGDYGLKGRKELE